MKSTRFIAFASAALLASLSVPAMALDLSGGGTSVSGGSTTSGGTTVSGGSGDTSLSATLGGGSNIATVGTDTGGTGGSLAIGNTNGDLATLNGTDANVNLGGLGTGSGVNDTVNGVTGPLGTILDGTGAGTGGAGGGTAGGRVVAAFGGLSGPDQRAIRLKCQTALANPARFNAETLALCRLLATR